MAESGNHEGSSEDKRDQRDVSRRSDDRSQRGGNSRQSSGRDSNNRGRSYDDRPGRQPSSRAGGSGSRSYSNSDRDRGGRDGQSRGSGRGPSRSDSSKSGGGYSGGQRSGGNGRGDRNYRSDGANRGGSREDDRSYGERSGSGRSYGERSGSGRSYGERSGSGRSTGGERGGRSYGQRDGESRYSSSGDGRRPSYGGRDGGPRGGSRDGNADNRGRSYGSRDGGRSRDDRSSGYSSGGRRSSGGGWDKRENRRDGDRGGQQGSRYGRDQVRRDDRRSERADGSRRGDRTTARPVTDVPEIPEEISIGQLDRTVRARLRTLSKDNAEDVGRHLVMAGLVLEIDPELAYRHAQVAVSRAGRVDVVREAGAVAAYATGRYAEALREFRTVRRLNGSHEHLALMADCERGLGRPERAIDLAREAESADLDARQRTELDIVVAGARMDLGEHEAAYVALGRINAPDEETRLQVEAARATVLRAMGRDDEAEKIEATLPVPTDPEDPWADDVTLYDTAELPDPDLADEDIDGEAPEVPHYDNDNKDH